LIGKPRSQWIFGTDYDQTDRLFLSQRDDGRGIPGPHVGTARRTAFHAGTPGRGENLGHFIALADFPSQRVFTSPGAYDEYVHEYSFRRAGAEVSGAVRSSFPVEVSGTRLFYNVKPRPVKRHGRQWWEWSK
jgi:hypothetical protein